MTRPTPERAASPGILAAAESRLLDLTIESAQADWVYATYITRESEALSARAYARLLEEAARFSRELGPGALDGSVNGRKKRLLRLFQPVYAPPDPAEGAEMTAILADLQATYARGRYAPRGASLPLDLEALSKILSTSRDPAEMADIWTGWHAVAEPMRPKYARFVEIANRGARHAGFDDVGAMWRSSYELDPAEFAREVERLWGQVEPLYRELYEYARRRLRAAYGASVVPAAGPMPAHLFGNMWAQSWEYLYPLLAPPDADPGFDLTKLLEAKGVDELEMVRYGERFFSSLGFEPLPATFWERSMFRRPADRDVVCHASAWDIDQDEDIRIKMCIERTAEEFHTIHHELGHNYYQRAYRRQPVLFRNGAHDGFHEAVGDTISLSITPEYLVRIGLLDRAPGPERDLGLLLHRALEKVVFLPFGLLIDLWRWKVFAGETGPTEYNALWWTLRERYQGLVAPAARPETAFDPGAKFHIPSNTPYMRYFLAHLLQFQFHRGLAKACGHSGPLHRFSLYAQPEAGRRLRAMLEMGQSRPWPEALAAVTGESRMDGSALLEYFAPLRDWIRRAA